MERRREAKIVLAGLRNETSVAELCRQHGVSDVMYYKWRKAFLEGGLGGLKGKAPYEVLRTHIETCKEVSPQV